MSATVMNSKPFQINQQQQMNQSFGDKQKENQRNLMNVMSIDSSQVGIYEKSLAQIPSHPQSAKSYRSSNQFWQQKAMDNIEINNYMTPQIGTPNNNQFFLKNHGGQPTGNPKSKGIGFPNTLMSFADSDNTKSLKKLMPKNIKKAKEVLYEGALVVKEKCNKLENENTKLKTQVLQLQKQNNKLQKLLYEIEESQNSGQVTLLSQPAVDNLLIMTLKKEQKQLQAEIYQKDAEIQSLKRSVRQTRIEELEIQLKCYIEETLRLKVKLDLLMREKQRHEHQFTSTYQKEGKVFIQNQVIDKLKQENFELKVQIIACEQRCQDMELFLRRDFILLNSQILNGWS